MTTTSIRNPGIKPGQADKQAPMSIRESLSSNKSVGMGVACAIIIVSVGTIAYQVVGMRNPARSELRVYYSVDDGTTFFVDGEERLPPFSYSGGTAVRAHVFEGSNGPFVGYLERFNSESRRIITKVNDAVKTAKPGDKPPPELALVSNAQRNGREVKKPGAGQWVSIRSSAAQGIMKVNRQGSNESAKELRPE